MTGRESGFYWVLKSGEEAGWHVGYYDHFDDNWYLTGDQQPYKDSDFNKIIEKRLERKDN